MDSIATAQIQQTTWSAHLPGWTLARGRDIDEIDAAFAAGIALKSLDDFLRVDLPWLGCWRDRLALKSAAVAARMLGRNEEEDALRDAVLLTPEKGDPGPAGRLFLATRMLARRTAMPGTAFVRELTELLSIQWDSDLSSIADLADAAIQSGRAAPLAIADLVSAIMALRPEAEVLALALADIVLARKLKWAKPVPLLLPVRFGSAFRTIGGRGRVRPGEPAYPKAICLAVVSSAEAALQSAADIDRRAARLMAAVPKVRTKGGDAVIQKLLNEDAIPASAPGCSLSRWAATRLFERLESFEAVREVSGRSSFRMYGL
ncbi:DUF1403 family protein [Rhizobium bangladeshense]|nr:DUF1403 family protein [Rhizobium bangladeshense]MBY3616780.1 DUF1403 family protein [Rhizobium bangladeshense]